MGDDKREKKEWFHIHYPHSPSSYFKIHKENCIVKCTQKENVTTTKCSQNSQRLFIEVADLAVIRKCLIVNGVVQSSEVDDAAFHEVLVHPAMLLHPNPKRVLIVGGGAGSTLREVLKHITVEECVMCDMDSSLVTISKQYLPHCHRGCFDDPRCTFVECPNLTKYVDTLANNYFDVIVLDFDVEDVSFVQTHQNGRSRLVSQVDSILQSVKLKLKQDDGVLVTHCGHAGIALTNLTFAPIYQMLVKEFKVCNAYSSFIQTMLGEIGFCCCSMNQMLDLKQLSREKVDQRIMERLLQKEKSLYFFNSSSLLQHLNAPKKVRQLLEQTHLPISMEYRPNIRSFVEITESEDLVEAYALLDVYYEGSSEFQDIAIQRFDNIGMVLVLDNLVQSAELDEFAYHEALVHPSMLLHPNPKRVFIAGGGEGCTLREVLKHKSVQECVMCDIDGVVVELCKKYLPSFHGGCLDDPRTTLVINDAKAYLEKQSDHSFDVIILDLADPVDGGPCYQLYTTEWYELCKSKLDPIHGVIVTQSSFASANSAEEVFSPIHNTIRQSFKKVVPYSSFVPSFFDHYGFNCASINPNTSLSLLTEPQVNELLEKRLIVANSLKWYDGTTHVGMIHFNKAVQKILNSETRIIKTDNYVVIKSTKELQSIEEIVEK